MQKKSISLCLAAVMAFGVSTTSFAALPASVGNATTVEATAVKAVSAWQANSSYAVGDKVTYQGKLYVCKVAHSRLKPTTAYVWTLLGDYKAYPDWVKGKTYVVGDKVSYEGHVYECIVDHFRLKPTTKYVWKMIE